jgi:putative chitinase
MSDEIIRDITPHANKAIAEGLEAGVNKYFADYEINTVLRMAHFLGQAAHETMGFTHLSELGGPSYFARYDGRRDLGNVQPGDGNRFHGRGIFQLTGRANYAHMSGILGVDLVANPELAQTPDISVRVACEYWKSHNLNAYADRDDCTTITKRINGGHNGLAERLRYTNLAKKSLIRHGGLPADEAPAPVPTPEPSVEAPIPVEPTATPPTPQSGIGSFFHSILRLFGAK